MPRRSMAGGSAVPARAACVAAWSCNQKSRSAVVSVAIIAPDPEAADANWFRDRRISETAMSTVPSDRPPWVARMTTNAIAPIRAAE